MKILFLLALTWVTFGTSACATDQSQRARLDDTFSSHTRALGVLESRPQYADRAQTQLLAVKMHLSRAERAYGGEDTDFDRAELLLKTSAAELAEIQTLYARWDEEARLENLRGDYAEKVTDIDRARKSNDAILNTAKGQQ